MKIGPVGWAAFALLFSLGVSAGSPGCLYRIGREGLSDCDALLAAGVPIVLETNAALVAEGDRSTAEALRAEGREVTLLDGDTGDWDYWAVTLRPDSDLEVLRAAGTVVHTEGGWLLLRVPRGGNPFRHVEARVFARPVPHEPIRRVPPAPLREGASARRPAGPAYAQPLVLKLVSTVEPAQIDAVWNHLAPPDGVPTPTRETSQAGCGDDSEYVYDTFLGWGVSAERQDYLAGYAPNVVATLPGAFTPSRVYIAVGHLDDKPFEGYAPGANDNASGVALLLEAARTMRCFAFKSTVKFLAVTGEETGMEGSTAYAKDAVARGEDIRAVLNMDMAGWEGDGVPATEDLDLNYNSRSQALAQYFAQCATDYGTGLPVITIDCPEYWVSDHSSFWHRGFAAVFGLTDNEGICQHGGTYPYYHQSTDTLAHCGDPTFFHNVVRTAVATLGDLAEPFRIAFSAESYDCSAPAQIVLGDRDLNTSPTSPQTVQVEVWSTESPAPRWVTLTEDGADSMIFRGTVPLTLHSQDGATGALPALAGSTIWARYVDAQDCDGATGVTYEASALVQGPCGPSLDFESWGPFAEIEGDGDAFLEPGERWSVPVTLRNGGKATATQARASLVAPGATACEDSVSFGTLQPGAAAAAAFTFAIPPSFTPCGGTISFSVRGKSCAEAPVAGPDDPDAFAAGVGHPSVPTSTSKVLQPSISDASVNQAAPATPSGAGTTMEVRNQLESARRALVAFDLSAIPVGSTVLSATLSLYATSAPASSLGLEVHRPSEPWTEMVTWDTQPSVGRSDASISGGTATGWKSWDVTAAVAAWVSGSAPNHGFQVKSTSEASGFAKTYAFATREAPAPENRPRLDVTYRPPTVWDCPYIGDAHCTLTAPDETAPGDTLASAETWTDRTTHRWPAAARASGYKVFRGVAAGLSHLLDSQGDSCLRWSGSETTCALGETPAAGTFYWYLVTASNTGGEGPAGDATAGARSLDSTGPCP